MLRTSAVFCGYDCKPSRRCGGCIVYVYGMISVCSHGGGCQSVPVLFTGGWGEGGTGAWVYAVSSPPIRYRKKLTFTQAI